MKILHINNKYAMLGGVERYILEISELLESCGHENVVLYQETHPKTIVDHRKKYLVQNTNHKDCLEKQLAEILFNELPDIAYLHYAFDPYLINVVSQIIPTVAYIHGFSPTCPALTKYFRTDNRICNRPFGLGCIPNIYLNRCSEAKHPITVLKLLQQTLKIKTAYLGIKQYLVASRYMSTLLQQNGYPKEKISILPYPILDIPDTSSIENDSHHILFTGRLEIEKGFPLLIRVLQLIPKEISLRVAGDGSLRENYESLVEKYGLSDRVHFLGWLDNHRLIEEYKKCGVLVVPSIFPEPFGQVGIQAMACGRPVVAFNVGGIPDWLHDEKYGFLIEPGAIEDFAKKTTLLLKDTTLANQMGEDARKYVVNNYGYKPHLDKLVTLLSRCSQP